MSTLRLVALTDSFSLLWPQLAAELGLEFDVVESPSEVDPHAKAIVVVAAAGREAELEPALLQMVTAGADVAAVGSESDHRLSAAVVRAGAAEYFALPGDLALLRGWLAERKSRLATVGQRAEFAATERASVQFDGLIGSSAALKAALKRAERVIPLGGVTVLLTGATGTGKELFARAIHYNGPRREAPFVDVNCAAIPEQLLESELFGHEKGAFTSATSAKPGLFELANGGTLFLDEIGHLPLPLQGKLLRALEEREVRRVGGMRSVKVDVRIIAATHVDLASAAERGEFREDLYYRLNVVPIELPPLRARREDILPLARHFLGRFVAEYELPTPSFTPAAERALQERLWPGNVRELRNAIERAVVLTAGQPIDAVDLEEEPRSRPGSNAVGRLPFPASLDEINRAAAQATVTFCNGNKSDAARRLGISRARLQRLLDAVGDSTTPDLELIDDDA